MEQWEFAQSKSEGGAVGQAVPAAAHFPDSTPTEPLDGDLDGFMPVDIAILKRGELMWDTLMEDDGASQT